MAEPKVMLREDGPLATLTLNRPEKLNAIDPEMLQLLEQALSGLRRSTECRVVLLNAAGGRAFSVGADINAWSALNPLEMWRWWIADGHRVFDQLAHLRQPVIAVLEGYAFGGGLELALAADIRIASTDAELSQPEVKLAAVPGWAGTQRLPALIGEARAKQMLFSGARVGAVQAERWGLVNEVVETGMAMPRARDLAVEIAGNAPLAVQLCKQLVDGGKGNWTGATLEALAGALAAGSADGREGVAAFRERRTAKFTGT
ncbi:MAG: enoyl-CoA hydratase/isomerase [Chloroflexi bacterium]|nr:enoyl-CoA hydratase/isomerase [Chloroflexota bacterium]